MRTKAFFSLVLALIALPWPLPAQQAVKSIGTPLIRQYDRADFNAGRQTWMIEQGVNGMMYFANNDGLLEYDGNHWKTYQLPGRTIIRCIKSDGKGRIYAGSFNEIGYFSPGHDGYLSFQSLKHLLPENERDFGEVWKIHLTPGGVVFQSFKSLIIINNDVAEMIHAPTQFHFSYYVNGELLVVDLREGVMRLALGKLFPVVGMEMLKGREIWSILPFDDKILLATSGTGVYAYDGKDLTPWATATSGILARSKIYCAMPLGDKYYAFGTIQNGLIITDLTGNIIQFMDREQGLQNNTVLSMNTDHYGNLWLGLDNGIDYIEINSPLSLLSHQHGLNAGYAAIIHNNILYLGTNQGVYATDWKEFSSGNMTHQAFRLIENTSGQVWVLQVIDDQLFCGHNYGTFLINDYQARLITDVSGVWEFLQLKDDPDKIMAGTYLGFILFEKRNGNWTFSRSIKGFRESSRDFLQDEKGDVWMSHGLKGIFRVRFNRSYDSVIAVTFYDSQSGLPSNTGMSLFKYRENVFFATEKGIYQFNQVTQMMEPAAALQNLMGDRFYRRVIIDRQGNIWNFTDSRAGVYRLQEDGSYLNISSPFEPITGNYIGGFEYVYPYDDKNVFFGVENGFIHYDPSSFRNYKQPLTAYIREMNSTNADTVLFRGMVKESFSLDRKISFNSNSVQFYFSANDFENPERLEYSTRLEGPDGSWSGWSSRNSKEFTNLIEGDYTFRVKARNIYLEESPPVSLSFSVAPPWRRSLLAYVIYGFMMVMAIVAVINLVRKKINRSKREAELAKERQFIQREAELKKISLEAEKEVIRLRNEKLNEEMLMKDKELANSTLQQIQKNKLLVNLIHDLKKLANSSHEPESRAQIRNMIKKINKDIDAETQWKVFEKYFENVHEEFLKRIKSQYPDLTPRELKLCAYLRLNISSKEIALLMNISARGVEISRYRLRRKLKLEHTTNLTDFIISF